MTKAAAPSPPPDASAPAEAEIASPPLAPGSAPLCFVVDEESSVRHFLSLILHGSGIDTVEFPDGAALRKAMEQQGQTQPPNLIFHNISLESADAIESVVFLVKGGFRGNVQLMSGRGAAVLEHVKAIGLKHKLNMLPVLKKPFETDAIVKIIQELKLGTPPATATRLSLEEALNKNWIEFWYQPKIDLRKKQLAGAEAFARARHPDHGMVLPGAFMPGANEASLIKLSEMAITNALKAGLNFSKLGINLRIAVNVPVPVLIKLPIVDMVKEYRPTAEGWSGLIIDVTEEQIVTDLALATELTKKLERSNVRLAIDDFGRGYSSLVRLKELPFAELKLDRVFVTDCGTDKVNAPLCKTVIDLAHNFGSTAVAIGIEKASDAVALMSMGCDYGQGFLLGQPMPEERFVSLLRQRAATQGRTLQPVNAAPAAATPQAAPQAAAPEKKPA
ncbi:MAG TPA: EAL domain-containing response regulator [Pseudolabrys sp.]|jgi:EAL domain-containing protein (putative c-di-GMP-specific phosphodiesterase class I)|nr:EAL domain-containing response regulator [Pseudolabrys sp.]